MLRFAIIALFCALAAPLWAVEVRGTVRVIDGDTFQVGETRVRLYGLDAPERDQPCTTLSGQSWSCGDWVTRQVRERYDGATARCVAKDRDRYDRLVAQCQINGHDVGAALVQDGLAYAYRRYAMIYDLQEKEAYVAERGIHGFSLQSPARYRLAQRSAPSAPDPSCRIKGNISAKGARIYHLPGQRFYQRTSIRIDKGERWFCSEAQARASGWRAARQ